MNSSKGIKDSISRAIKTCPVLVVVLKSLLKSITFFPKAAPFIEPAKIPIIKARPYPFGPPIGMRKP